MKTLIVVAHPELSTTSKLHKRWVKELEEYPDEFTVHKLYELYPDEQINTENEQKLIESHGSLILEFPLYWSNCPPLMKKWIDKVFTHGWAFGSKATAMRNRKVALAVSGGTEESVYKEKFDATLQQVLLPFEIAFKYMNADYRGFTAITGLEHNVEEERVEGSTQGYIDFIKNI